MSAFTLQVLDANGLIRLIAVDQDGGGALYSLTKATWGAAGSVFNIVDDTPTLRLPVNISRRQAQFVNTPTIQAAAYSSGNCAGGLITFPSFVRAAPPAGGRLRSLLLSDASGQESACEVWLFNANPNSGGTTITDRTAFALANADLPKVMAIAQIGGYRAAGAKGVAFLSDLDFSIMIPNGSNIAYAAIILRGTPTYVSGADLTLTLNVEQD